MGSRDSNTCRIEISHCRCVVCENISARFVVCVGGFTYLHCPICHAIYLDQMQRLSDEEEYARYLQHRNDSHDEGYRRFLSKLSNPLLEKLSPGAKGLDFGCGPGPALAHMLCEAGHRMRLFDLFFFPDPEPLEDTYDFITCTETIEHLHHPAETFARFDKILKPGGWLALMTCFLTDETRFASWHYRRDPTHVVFYRAATLRHIAVQFGWSCEIPVKDVALMRKPHITIHPNKAPAGWRMGRSGVGQPAMADCHRPRQPLGGGGEIMLTQAKDSLFAEQEVSTP